MAFTLQCNIVIIGHAVVAMDTKALYEQELREVEADETGGARDHDAHVINNLDRVP